MHLPRSILYPLVGLFILGGIYYLAFKGVFLILIPVLLFLFLLGFYFINKKFKAIKSLLLYVCFFYVGYFNFQSYYTPSDSHYLNIESDKTVSLKKIKILEKRHENSFSYSYVGELIQMDHQTTTGKLLIYHPKIIIADGSNTPWFVDRWGQSCNKKAISFYDTRKKGALKISL